MCFRIEGDDEFNRMMDELNTEIQQLSRQANIEEILEWIAEEETKNNEEEC